MTSKDLRWPFYNILLQNIQTQVKLLSKIKQRQIGYQIYILYFNQYNLRNIYKIFTMTSSPYIPETLRNYLTQFKIEELINRCINDISKQMPTDPYSFIVNTFQKNASLDIQISQIKAAQIFNPDVVPVLSIRVKALFMGKQKTIVLSPFGIANDQPVYLFDQDRLNGKGLKKGIQFIQQLNSILKHKVCSNQTQIDNSLIAAYETKGNKGLYQVNICSYIPSFITSRLLDKPLYEVFQNVFGVTIKQPAIKVCINCLQGSKIVGSKCKIFKYMLISEQLTDPMLIISIIQSIKKTIVSGKGGEAALKYSPDGTFICPLDSISDNLKIVEDAINANSANFKDKVTIGLSWMADNYYNPDQKKYQLQNPKALLDTDQLIQYYFKLCTDRQHISYIQDPIFSQDCVGWAKLQKKFQGHRVRIGSRKVFASLEAIKNNTPISKQDRPQLQESQILQINNKKIKIHSHWYKPFELMTLSKLVNIYKQLKKQQTVMILSQNMIETPDTTLVDLCYATGSYLNISSPLKYNQINKLNRISQILNL